MPAVHGSFRDPSGHVFTRSGRLLRQINPVYASHYDHLCASGLYGRLVERTLLVPHREVADAPDAGEAHRIIEPERIPFISYPFEWAFSQLQDAALATLAAQRTAVGHGMVLKDASAYNVQFRGTNAVLIDTLSFERWKEGTPWVAYRQFCQHFLGPLALMSATDARLGSLSRVFIDGAPLDLVSALLPFSSRLHPSLLVHLHLHARAQAKHGGGTLPGPAPTRFTAGAMLGLIDSLESAVGRLKCATAPSVWKDYYAHTNYSEAAMADKRRIVTIWIGRQRPSVVWDLGANTGAFSEIAEGTGAYTIAFDGDHAAVEQHYLDCRSRGRRALPLVMDLANPSGPMGWDHRERLSLSDRGPADLVLALGLIHHLSLANQVPFSMSAECFERLGRTVIVEFVPKSDSQVQGMLSRMPSADVRYDRDAFERAFEQRFEIVETAPIAESERRLYLMRSRAAKAAAA